MFNWLIEVLSGEKTIRASELKPGDVMRVGFMSWTVRAVTVREDSMVIVDCSDYCSVKKPDESVTIRRF